MGVMATPASHKLSSIEALRGLAATAVVLSHAARHVDKAYGDPVLIAAFQAGHAGVDLFFVISGFIILFVHHGDINRPDRLPNYARRRFTRVMPLYWTALLVTLAMGAAGSHALPSSALVLWSASLLPMMQEPLLGIAWTLQYEAVFYVVFAVLILRRTAGLAVLGVWLAIVASVAGLPDANLPGSLSSTYVLEFFFGMGAAHLVLRRRVPVPLANTVAGVALFGASLVLESTGILDGYGTLARIAYGIPAAFVVAGLAARDQVKPLPVPAWLRSLGAASYSIYLFQFVFIGMVWQAWSRVGLGRQAPHVLLFALLAISAIVGGLLASRFVEQPLLRLVRSRHARPALQGT